ncbi:EAL domain-containing protein [Oceanomicrobium pacificus]|uniref:EAL domain-containing protein n=1 Tax=Oceanomicrobium pacificus TaxID=2692916 RepID=A0A6B0TS13_9RHOB|nr:EAL domain-containing protein [Oceanomicrobium pacificus]MXU63992.1 EAL domain-containing protein [Oceanomicrobium pacificus]
MTEHGQEAGGGFARVDGAGQWGPGASEETGPFALALQPVRAAGAARILFCEALLRQRGPDGHMAVPPALLSGSTSPAACAVWDCAVLERAFAHLRANPLARLSVNVEPTTLEHGLWRQTCARLGDGPWSRLIVELTERRLPLDPASLKPALDALHSRGAALAIDDFGAGRTALRHLIDWPVDMVKFDCRLCTVAARDAARRAVLGGLVRMAGQLDLLTVAEGVEDADCAGCLTALGVDGLQGFHIGAPALSDPAAPAALRRTG